MKPKPEEIYNAALVTVSDYIEQFLGNYHIEDWESESANFVATITSAPSVDALNTHILNLTKGFKLEDFGRTWSIEFPSIPKNLPEKEAVTEAFKLSNMRVVEVTKAKLKLVK